MKWQEARLDELGTVSRGRSRHRPRDAAHLYGGPYPFVQTGDVKAAGLHLTKHTQTYTEAGLAQSKLWPAGTLCITIAANIADTAILSYDACFPDSVIGFIPDPEKADARFVKYLFDAQLKRRYRKFTQGVAQDNLSQEKLLSILFQVPGDVRLQRALADLLSTYDDLIENNRRRIVLLESLTRNLYQEWFVRLRFPGHETTKIMDGVPNGWSRSLLSDCARVNHRSLKSSHTGEIRYVDISSVSEGRVEEVKPMSFAMAPSRARRLVADGDTIWSCVRPNLRAFAFIGSPPENLVVSTGFAVISPNERNFSEFLNLHLTTTKFVDYLTSVATGTSYPAVVADDFLNSELLLPTKTTMASFHEAVCPIYLAITNLEQHNLALSRARDLLLPRLVSGELEP